MFLFTVTLDMCVQMDGLNKSRKRHASKPAKKEERLLEPVQGLLDLTDVLSYFLSH